MKTLGNDKYIQRGETWSLDFQVTNEKGDPFMLLKEWLNPYLAITVTAARYAQLGDFRKTWWLDMSQRYVEQFDGSYLLVPVKKFTSTEALYVSEHTIEAVLAAYEQIVLDNESLFDIKNFLFYTDPLMDGNRVYKYVDMYTEDTEVWEEYSFRIIKNFDTRDWVEQTYLYDIKVLIGESISEHVYNLLTNQGLTPQALPWTEQETREHILEISNVSTRNTISALFESGQPIMPDWDTKGIILYPSKLIVGADIQGGM